MTFQSKLNPAEVLELQRLYRDKGFTVRELSVIYRISERTVYRKVANLKPIKLARLTPKQQARVKKKPELKPCGTNAAYQRHRRNGEYPCDPCLAAHAKNVAKAKRKKNRNAKSRSRTRKARSATLSRNATRS